MQPSDKTVLSIRFAMHSIHLRGLCHVTANITNPFSGQANSKHKAKKGPVAA